jgi:hypothetical protein
VIFAAKKDHWENYRKKRGSSSNIGDIGVPQTIQILREGEILLKKKLVPVILIEEPLHYPGCAWEPSLKGQALSFSEVVDPSQAQAVLSNRDLFFKKMKQANEIGSKIKGFVESFIQNKDSIPVTEKGNYIHDFISEYRLCSHLRHIICGNLLQTKN